MILFIIVLVQLGNVESQQIIPDDYNKAFRPLHTEGKPLEISFSIKVNGIQEVNLETMTVKIHMYLRVSWIDNRLMYPKEYANNSYENSVSLHADWLDRIWRPDHFFRLVHNIVEFKLLQRFIGVKMFPDKTILTSSLYEIEFGCPMNFEEYPFDSQKCIIFIGSYFYTVNEVTYVWDKLGLVIDDVVGQQLADYEFTLVQVNETVCPCPGCIPDTTPCIQLILSLTRHYLVYLLGFYIPSSLFVMVSWTSFFWPPEVIPGRTVLVITSLLTVYTLYGTSRADSPKTSYVKALDAWMFFTIISGVLTLFQYAIVLQWIKRKTFLKEMKIHPLIEDDREDKLFYKTKNDQAFILREQEIQKYERYLRRTELVGRIGLPLLFLTFNLVYWPIFV